MVDFALVVSGCVEAQEEVIEEQIRIVFTQQNGAQVAQTTEDLDTEFLEG